MVNGADGIAQGFGHLRDPAITRPALVAALSELLRRYLVRET